MKKVKKANLLQNLRTFEVSLVDKGAIGEEFTIIKRAPEADSDDFAEIKKTLGEDGFKAFEQEFEKSFQEHMGDDEVMKEHKPGIFKSLIQKAVGLAKGEIASVVEPVDFLTNFKNRMIRNNVSDHFWSLTDALRDTVFNILSSNEANKNEIIKETLVAFSDMVLSLTTNTLFTASLTKRFEESSSEEVVIKMDIQPEEIQKLGKKISAARMEKLQTAINTINEIISENQKPEEDDVMKAEDIEKLGQVIAKALEPVNTSISELNKRLEGVEKKDDDQPEGEVKKNDDQPEGEVKKNAEPDLATLLGTAITKALEPVTASLEGISKRVETVEKSAETSRKLTDDGNHQEIKKNETKWPSFNGR